MKIKRTIMIMGPGFKHTIFTNNHFEFPTLKMVTEVTDIDRSTNICGFNLDEP